MSHLFLRRVPRTLPSPLAHHRNLTTTSRLLAWKGSSGEDHITNSKDELDVHSAGAKAGKRDRAEDNKQSSAASERDSRKDNKRAQEDHPEAPGPVIGMNDERGGVGFFLLHVVALFCLLDGLGAHDTDMCAPGYRRDIEGGEQSGGDREGTRTKKGQTGYVAFSVVVAEMERRKAATRVGNKAGMRSMRRDGDLVAL